MRLLFGWSVTHQPWILRITLLLLVGCLVWWQIVWFNYPAIFSIPPKFETFLVHPFHSNQQIAMLPDLNELRWPVIQVAKTPTGFRFPNGTFRNLPPAFEPVMSLGQRKVTERLLSCFSNSMFKHGLGNRFLLYGGALLGSYRHHDMIPWDDDIDVLVDLNVRKEVQSILSDMAPNYLLFKQSNRDKFYTAILNKTQDLNDVESSLQTSSYKWGWPYIDIGYFLMNDTHVWELAHSYGRAYWWPKKVVFPLTFRPFGRQWYPSPFNLYRFLKDTYPSLDQCIMNGYSHVFEGFGNRIMMCCQKLGERFAFVERVEDKKSAIGGVTWVEEELVEHGLFKRIIHKIRLPWISDYT